MIELSIVIPCYKKEYIIREALKEKIVVLDSLNIPYQIITVVDGKIDNTQKEINRVGSRKIKVISYKDNKGKGYAVREGVKYATGKYICYIDSDKDIDPSILKDLYEKILKTKSDIVTANKFDKKSIYKKSVFRRTLSRIYKLLIRSLIGVNVNDTQTGAKIFKREVIKDIIKNCSINGFAFDVEIFSIAAKKGYKKITEIPVIIHQYPHSSIKPRLVFRMFIDTIKIFIRHKSHKLV